MSASSKCAAAASADSTAWRRGADGRPAPALPAIVVVVVILITFPSGTLDPTSVNRYFALSPSGHGNEVVGRASTAEPRYTPPSRARAAPTVAVSRSLPPRWSTHDGRVRRHARRARRRARRGRIYAEPVAPRGRGCWASRHLRRRGRSARSVRHGHDEYRPEPSSFTPASRACGSSSVSSGACSRLLADPRELEVRDALPCSGEVRDARRARAARVEPVSAARDSARRRRRRARLGDVGERAAHVERGEPAAAVAQRAASRSSPLVGSLSLSLSLSRQACVCVCGVCVCARRVCGVCSASAMRACVCVCSVCVCVVVLRRAPSGAQPARDEDRARRPGSRRAGASQVRSRVVDVNSRRRRRRAGCRARA